MFAGACSFSLVWGSRMAGSMGTALQVTRSRLSPSGSPGGKGSYSIWVWVRVIWKMAFGGKNRDWSLMFSDSFNSWLRRSIFLPLLLLRLRKTTVLSGRAPAPTAGTSSCFFLKLLWGTLSGPGLAFVLHQLKCSASRTYKELFIEMLLQIILLVS